MQKAVNARTLVATATYLALTVPAALAQEVTESDEQVSAIDQLALFNESLQDQGISFELYYNADFFSNTKGGLSTNGAFQYRGLFDFGITLETGPLGLWDDGTLFVNVINNHGIDITERYVGDLQVINNADAPNDTRLYEYWYEQGFLDQRVRIKFGKIDANNDFAGGLYRDEFVHSSPGFSPTMPLPTWPDPALGIILFLEPTDWFYLNIGLFDGMGSGTRSGFETAFHVPDDSFTIAELGFRPTLSLFGQDNLPGQYAFGGWYHSGKWDVLPNDPDSETPPLPARGNHGVYVAFDQLLFREPPDNDGDVEVEESETEQGLGVFFQFGWSPEDRNEISQHYGGGFQYYGPIPGRDDDVFGVGVQHINLSDRIQSLERRYAETAIEVFYKIAVNDRLSVKPDLHYVVDPGGAGRDALVAGVRLEWSF
ncbi:MAG: carbohydrate porin [Phycisphaerae bacterium]